MFKILNILLLSLTIIVATVAQNTPTVATKPINEKSKPFSWGTIKDLPVKTPFVSLDGRFSIGLSPNIQGFSGLTPKTLGFNASGSEFTWKYDEGEIYVTFLDYSKDDFKGLEIESQRLINSSKNRILKTNPKATVLGESVDKKDKIFLATQSLEILEDQFLLQRIYGIENRLYRLISVFKGKENIGFVDSAFDSFKLISQSEVEAELQKKYESMKPPSLPQTPAISKLKSDAKDEELKGKIKKIITESEDLSGTWSVQGRKKSWVYYFDEQGNFLQKDFYDYKGLPDRISVYGYIDGKRVSNAKSVSYDDNPTLRVSSALSNKKAELLKPDTRYQTSYEFKYHEGKLIEMILKSNTDEIWMRYKYKYTKNRVEELIYSSDGKLNQHYVSIIDNDGNEIEKTSLDVLKIYGEKKYRYEYEFDNQGNWIKQITLQEETKNGIKLFKPYSVYYRTITYW